MLRRSVIIEWVALQLVSFSLLRLHIESTRPAADGKQLWWHLVTSDVVTSKPTQIIASSTLSPLYYCSSFVSFSFLGQCIPLTLFPPIHVHALIYETGAVVHAPKVSPKFPFSSFIKMPLESWKAGSKFPYFPYFCRKNRKNGENSLLLPYFGP